MLSKEEIEFTIKTAELMMKLPINNSIIIPVEEVKKLFEYIQQLETREQKLIDKLEEDIEKFNRKENVFMTQSSQINASLISYINEILSIVKGEDKCMQNG